jgi:hypothetical protein
VITNQIFGVILKLASSVRHRRDSSEGPHTSENYFYVKCQGLWRRKGRTEMIIYIYICIYMSTITIMIITYFNSNIIVAAEKIVTIFKKKYFEGRNCRCFKRHEEITDQLSAMKSS